VVLSDSDEEDASPIEMTLVNRREARKKRTRKDSDSHEASGSNEELNLKLYEQDEENQGALDQQPQDPNYNPFDEVTDPQVDTDVHGQAVLNEIDDALDSDEDDDDGGEFGEFV